MNDLIDNDICIDLNTIDINDLIISDKNKLSDSVERKFVAVNSNVKDWEVETDKGWSDILSVGKTIPYKSYRVTLEDGKTIQCADNHIFFDSEMDEVFAKDLNKGTRPDRIFIKGEDGQPKTEFVKEVYPLKRKVNMYDLQVRSENHRYYTNDILSHNSIFLCNEAINFVLNGYNTLFISFEMSTKKILKRVSANMLNMTQDEYDEVIQQPDIIKRKLATRRAMQDPDHPYGKFFIKQYPTGAGSVIDIKKYLNDLQKTKNVEIQCIVLDYVNIMQNARATKMNSDNMYSNVKQITEDLRAIAVENNILVVSATQINRGGFDSSVIGMGDVAESAGLLYTADSLIAITQTPEMRANNNFALQVLKARDGTARDMRVDIKIDYDKMKLTEITGNENNNQQMDFSKMNEPINRGPRNVNQTIF